MPPPETTTDSAPDATPDATPEAAEALETTDPPAEGEAVEEPSLRAHLVELWHRVPFAVRWGAVGAVALLLALAVVPPVLDAAEGPTDEERLAEAARERAMWAAALRMDPAELDTAIVANALGPGDAERADDRYADYYVHEADSVAFSVLVTSSDFAPDLAVRLPDGRELAASDLLQTDTRAEIDGLQGPGRFEVVVTSRDPRARGAYELAVLPARPADSLYVDDEARLDTLGGGARRAGRFERMYGLATDTDLPIVIRVVSSAFRPRIQLIGPNGQVRDASWSLETSAQGDSLFGAVARYMPGWEAPYRLLVSSETPGARGAFALDARSVPIRDLAVNSSGIRRTLGDESWLQDGHYLDTYRIRIPEDRKTTVRVTSDAFPPAFRLWRIERQARAEVAEALNAAGANAAQYEGTLDAGEYYVEVTSGGRAEDDDPPEIPLGGEYGLVVRAESLEPAPAPPRADDGEDPKPSGSKVFSTEVRRTGQSGGSSFEVGVTNVAISYPGSSRTRVQLSVTVRSIDYTGNWAPWASFAGQAYVVDDRGRRYTVSQNESSSPSGSSAEPGTARRGVVVFYHPKAVGGLERLVLVASVGDESVTLPIPVP